VKRNTLCTSGFVDGVMFSDNGAYTVTGWQWSSTSDPSPLVWVIMTRLHLAANDLIGWLSEQPHCGAGQNLPFSTVLFSKLYCML